MDIHVCKQCGSRFVYCRACTFRPVRYKDAGFCSKECYEASKNIIVEPEIIEEVVLVEEPAPIVEEVQATDDVLPVEPEVVASVELPVIEEPVVVATTPKKETNTYKKKKNKYEYTSSY